MISASQNKLPSNLPFPLNEIAAAFDNLDVIWFRAFAIVTSLCGIIYKFVHPVETPLWMVVCWNIVFVSINFIQIFLLLQERRGVRFNEDEKELYDTVFSRLTPVEFMKLLRIGQWRNLAVGAVLAIQGEPLHEMLLLYNGGAEVVVDGTPVASLRDGAFIGEMSLLQEGPASATVTATVESRCLVWPKAELKELLERNPALGGVVHSIVATDLTRKLLKK